MAEEPKKMAETEEAVEPKKMTAKQIKYLIYLAMRKDGETRFGQVIDRYVPVQKLVGMLNCVMCGKWVKSSAAVCQKEHLTCGPHSRIVPGCTFETPGNVEFGPVGEFGEACGLPFRKYSFKFIRVFHTIAKLLKETGGIVGTPTKDEELEIRKMFLGIYDEYLEEVIQWAKSVEDQITD